MTNLYTYMYIYFCTDITGKMKIMFTWSLTRITDNIDDIGGKRVKLYNMWFFRNNIAEQCQKFPKINFLWNISLTVPLFLDRPFAISFNIVAF